jgi:hypothetical protein
VGAIRDAADKELTNRRYPFDGMWLVAELLSTLSLTNREGPQIFPSSETDDGAGASYCSEHDGATFQTFVAPAGTNPKSRLVKSRGRRYEATKDVVAMLMRFDPLRELDSVPTVGQHVDTDRIQP